MTTTNTNLTSNSAGSSVAHVGQLFIRFALVGMLLWVGLLKFTAYEAKAIEPLVSNSPLMSWGYNVLSVQSFSILIGVTEIILGLLIAAHFLSPIASAVGSAGAVVMFLITLSFVFTTPPAWQEGYGFPFPSPMPGQFLLKDLLALAVAVWLLGQSLTAIAARRATMST